MTCNCINHQSVFKSDSIAELKEYGKQNNLIKESCIEHKLILVGYAVLIKRHVLELIAYLDERFFPGNKEDDDLSLRILQSNYQNVIVHNYYIIHLGGESFDKIDRRKILIENTRKFNFKYHLDVDSDSFFKLYFDSKSLFYEGCLDSSIQRTVLDVNCEMGARMAHLAYLHSNIDFYGLDQSIQCATISRHLEGVHIEHYFDIERSMKFDLIALDCSKIKKNDLYYMNWYPIMKGQTQSLFSINEVYCNDIDEMMKKLDLKVESWIFYFGNIDNDLKPKIEDIQNIVGDNSKFLIESTAYVLHK